MNRDDVIPALRRRSADPLSISLDERSDWRARGNLVRNPSFAPHTGVPGADVPGWTCRGSGVRFLADTGRPHVLCVERPCVDECAAPAGVLSDPIAVLPGNYDFSCWLKLRGVRSNRERLGALIEDAVELRVHFYDAAGTEIDPFVVHPWLGCRIDTGFKGFPFASFRAIEDFGWGLVRCRSAHYPFSEGDLPEGTCSVRLFIGLRGSGVLLADDPEFSYSRWNFTPKERLQPYLGEEPGVFDLLQPAPRRLVRRRALPWRQAGEDCPLIRVPAQGSAAVIAAAELLRSRISDAVVETGLADCTTGPRLRIVIARGDDPFLRPWGDILHGGVGLHHAQGYAIRFPDDRTAVLAGADDDGCYWAATTMVQLLDSASRVLTAADIDDWPTFLGRAWACHQWQDEQDLARDIDGVVRMSLVKLNRPVVMPPSNRSTRAWWDPDPPYREGLVRLGATCRRIGALQFGFMVHPYLHFKFEERIEELSPERRRLWFHADDTSRRRLFDAVDLGMGCGARVVMLMADDMLPHAGTNPKAYALWEEEDRRRFGDLAAAQARMIRDVRRRLDATRPGTRLEFCPPWYLNEFVTRSRGFAEAYFAGLLPRLPPSVPLVWCGGTVRSLVVDEADYRQFVDITGRKPMYWDNTLYARTVVTANGGYPVFYPRKVVLCSLLEPYDVQLPANFADLIDGACLYVNGSALSDAYRIKYATVAEYAWHPEAYDPDRACWKALVREAGLAGARLAVEFNDGFYRLVRARLLRQHPGEGEPSPEPANDLVRSLEVVLAGLRDVLPTSSRLADEFASELSRERELADGTATGAPT